MFSEHELSLCYVNLRDVDVFERERLCRRFYNEIYREAFPNLDEAETPDVWLPLMKENLAEGLPMLHLILAIDVRFGIVGGVIFERYPRTGFWLATYMVVHPRMQNAHVGKRLLAQAILKITSISGPNFLMLAETENPDAIEDLFNSTFARSRLKALSALGFSRIPFSYIQPALSPTKKSLDILWLICYTPNGFLSLNSTDLIAFLKEFYQVLGQPDSLSFHKMSEELFSQETISSVPFF